MSAYGPDSYYAQNLKMGRQGNDTGMGSAWDNPGGRQQLQGRPQMSGGMMQPQQKQGGGGIFGGLKSAIGGIFGNKSKFNPMNAPGLSNIGKTLGGGGMGQPPPMNQGIGPGMGTMNKFGMGGMKPPQMGGGAWNQMPGMNTGMKPPMSGGQPGGTGGFMKPPMMGGGGSSWAEQNPNQPSVSRTALPGYNGGATTMDMVRNPYYKGGMNEGGQQPQMGAPMGGLGPSMPAMQNMLQQPEQSQQPAAAGPMPEFGRMNQFGGQPLNRGYGRM